MAEMLDKYNCTNCQDEIPGIRVHCVECSDFDLCLQCFAAGAEAGNHRNDHSYQLMDTSTLSIFRGKGSWSAREEIHLLDAIEKYGFGNWEIISKHIETRSPEETREEYVSKFLNGSIGRLTWIPAAESYRPNLIDHTVNPDVGPLGGKIIQKLRPLEVTAEQSAQLGYLPNRDDFDREYDPTAEQLVSSLTLNPDDDDTDMVLKLAQVDIYTRRLRERARRKRLVRDYQLVANFFGSRSKHGRHSSREQREFRDRFRVFAQFFTSHEYEQLLNSIKREKELRIRLSELHRYRWNGLTRIDECVHFEQHAAAAQHRNTGPYGYGRTDNQHHTGNRQGLFSHSLLNKKTEERNAEAKGCDSIVQRVTHHIGDPTCYDGLLPNKKCLDSYRGSSGLSNTNSNSPTTTTAAATMQGGNQSNNQYLIPPQNQIYGNVTNNNTKQIQQQPDHANKSQGLQHQPQIHQAPGEDLLSKNEIQLCTVLNLPATRYISLKTVLLSGAPLSSTGSQIENVIRNFFVKAGWLSH